MALYSQIENDFQQAFKERKEDEISTLRLFLAALKNERIKKMADLTEEDIIKVLKSEMKKRKESISEYEKADRQELADKEKKELAILEKYQPKQLSEDEVRTKVKEILASLAERDNLGKVMGQVMAELKNQADGNLIRKIVEEEISK
ncbi:MAG TPA: GatB/YqeY domain-containing protein [Candidatus Uhrbacteria bacterium]|nr:GatB/YqeY domain-containing protein [Candidatus Uhrbacteria bacterium]